MSLFCVIRFHSSNADISLRKDPMVSQKALIFSEQLGVIVSSAAPFIIHLYAVAIRCLYINVGTSTRGIFKTAILLCGVNFCRILIREGFEANTSHNGQLHIIHQVNTSSLLSLVRKSKGIPRC